MWNLVSMGLDKVYGVVNDWTTSTDEARKENATKREQMVQVAKNPKFAKFFVFCGFSAVIMLVYNAAALVVNHWFDDFLYIFSEEDTTAIIEPLFYAGTVGIISQLKSRKRKA